MVYISKPSVEEVIEKSTTEEEAVKNLIAFCICDTKKRGFRVN